MSKKPAALIILDGFGLRGETVGNAVAQAKKPNFDRYWNEFPHQTLTASGEAVGLPEGQMGNSEVVRRRCAQSHPASFCPAEAGEKRRLNKGIHSWLLGRT